MQFKVKNITNEQKLSLRYPKTQQKNQPGIITAATRSSLRYSSLKILLNPKKGPVKARNLRNRQEKTNYFRPNTNMVCLTKDTIV